MLHTSAVRVLLRLAIAGY